MQKRSSAKLSTPEFLYGMEVLTKHCCGSFWGQYNNLIEVYMFVPVRILRVFFCCFHSIFCFLL